MAELFASGRLVDFILIVVVVEATVLLLLWRRARRGVAPAAPAGSQPASALRLPGWRI